VAFLEDDDAFDPRKVERLRDVFRPGSRTDYYHNDYREIDEAGRDTPSSPQRRDIDRRVKGRGVERFEGSAKRDSFLRILDSVPEAHLSCVAIRRSELEPILERLESVPIGVDFFLFFVGLASEGGLVIDPEKLTLYRHHSASSSRSLAEDPSWYDRLIGGTRRMSEATRAMLRDRNAVMLLPSLEDVLAAHELFVRTTAASPNRRALVAALAAVLRHPRGLRAPGRPALLLQAVLHLIHPSWARRLVRAGPRA
jgi:hypothetical protein